MQMLGLVLNVVCRFISRQFLVSEKHHDGFGIAIVGVLSIMTSTGSTTTARSAMLNGPPDVVMTVLSSKQGMG